MGSLQNEKGFTLVEMMIAGVILGGLALFMADLWINQARRQNDVINKSSFVQMTQETQQAAINPPGIWASADIQVPPVSATCVTCMQPGTTGSPMPSGGSAM